MKKHKHHDIIIAWANGATIQRKDDDVWKDVLSPLWKEAWTYRIKPEPPKMGTVMGREVQHGQGTWYAALAELKEAVFRGENVGVLVDKIYFDGYDDGYVDGSGFTEKSSCNC